MKTSFEDLYGLLGAPAASATLRAAIEMQKNNEQW
jgi:hypothetical protein